MKKIILLLLVMALNACNNDDDTPTNPIDQLPPPTQTGENTFGCLINGEALVITNTREQVAIYQQGQLQFGGRGVTMILVNPINVNENYSLIGKGRYIIERDKNSVECYYYDFQDSYTGSVKFSKIDQINYIISGTFEFSTVTDNCETINITNGRFDMRYIP